MFVKRIGIMAWIVIVTGRSFDDNQTDPGSVYRACAAEKSPAAVSERRRQKLLAAETIQS